MGDRRFEDGTFGEVLVGVVDAFSDLVQLHLTLAKAELARDAGRLATDLGPLAVGVPLLGVGYLLVCVAAAAGLATLVGPVWGFGALGLMHLTAGGIAVRVTVRRRSRPAPVDRTVGSEVARTAREMIIGPSAGASHNPEGPHGP